MIPIVACAIAVILSELGSDIDPPEQADRKGLKCGASNANGSPMGSRLSFYHRIGDLFAFF